MHKVYLDFSKILINWYMISFGGRQVRVRSWLSDFRVWPTVITQSICWKKKSLWKEALWHVVMLLNSFPFEDIHKLGDNKLTVHRELSGLMESNKMTY